MMREQKKLSSHHRQKKVDHNVWLSLTHRPASFSSTFRMNSKDCDGMIRCVAGMG
jgi:hypothetical protein